MSYLVPVVLEQGQESSVVVAAFERPEGAVPLGSPSLVETPEGAVPLGSLSLVEISLLEPSVQSAEWSAVVVEVCLAPV